MDNKQKKILLIFGTVAFLILIFAIWKSTKHDSIPVIIPPSNSGAEIDSNACKVLRKQFETYVACVQNSIDAQITDEYKKKELSDDLDLERKSIAVLTIGYENKISLTEVKTLIDSSDVKIKKMIKKYNINNNCQ